MESGAPLSSCSGVFFPSSNSRAAIVQHRFGCFIGARDLGEFLLLACSSESGVCLHRPGGFCIVSGLFREELGHQWECILGEQAWHGAAGGRWQWKTCFRCCMFEPLSCQIENSILVCDDPDRGDPEEFYVAAPWILSVLTWIVFHNLQKMACGHGVAGAM